MTSEIDRVVDCPACHEICGWCSWYAKNARQCGCGSASKRRCEWGESLKGTVCPMCLGTEKVRLVGRYVAAADPLPLTSTGEKPS
jgi:hypothetical protein